MFNASEEKTLLDIFKIYAPSNGEQKMIAYIEYYLKKHNLPYTKDENGNIFNVSNKNRPLLSAHMDSVGDSNCGFLNAFVNIFDYRGDRLMKGMGNIGGDDKCGIFLILRKLLTDNTLNFIFTIGEERGCIGINQVLPKNDISELPYGLVLDRRGSGDIICVENFYGNKEFDAALAEVGKEFGYTSQRGLSSDAGKISDYINCANLSVAYHNPHSKNEFVSLTQLYNTSLYLDAIIERFKDKKFDKNKKFVSSYSGGYTNSKTSTSIYGDDEYGYYDEYGTWHYKQKQADYYRLNFYCNICGKYKPNADKVTVKSDKGYTETICWACDSKRRAKTK